MVAAKKGRTAQSLAVCEVPMKARNKKCLTPASWLHRVWSGLVLSVTLTIQDGGVGDDDLTANGVIVALGAPVVFDEAVSTPTPTLTFTTPTSASMAMLGSLTNAVTSSLSGSSYGPSSIPVPMTLWRL